MAELWATEDLPGTAWDDEPPDEPGDPCITTIDVLEEYL